MVTYTFSIENANQQYIAISVVFNTPLAETTIHIPAWRPGRYELGNFAKNIKSFKVFNGQNKRVDAKKTSKDAWIVETSSTESIRVEYSYYASELNAGSTYLSPDQLYVNPVNCCIYTSDQVEEDVSVKLLIPKDWKVSGSMRLEDNVLYAANFDELADSPFICSAKFHAKSSKV